MSGKPRIAVVIVTYNSAAVLDGCLRALAAQQGVELTSVVVADNASTDGSLALARAFAPAANSTGLPVTTVEVGRNGGYSAGINAGMTALAGQRQDQHRNHDAILILNPDCRPQPASLALLARALQQPGRGIAVPRLLNPDGTQHHSLRRAPSVRGAFAEAIIGGNRAGRRGGSGEMITDAAVYERPGPAVWATGAAMMISAAAAEHIGPWDESFFLYSEETEFALRAADKGWTLWYEPQAVVEHIGGESKTNTDLAALLVVNKIKLFRRRHGTGASSAYYVAVALGQSARAVAGSRTARAAVKALVNPKAVVNPSARKRLPQGSV